MRRPVVLLALLASCTSGAGSLVSSDRRVDGATAENDPESVSPRMCLTDDGVHVAWIDDRDGVAAVWVASSDDGGEGWSDPVRADHGTVGAASPTLACAGETLHVAWEDRRDGLLDAPNVYVNRSTDAGSTWQTEVRLGDDVDGERQSRGPALVAAGDRVHVAWFDDQHGAYDVFLASSADAGVTFGSAVRLDGDEAGAAYSAWPRVHGDADGHVIVTWEDARGGASDVFVRASADGGATFWPEVRLDAGDAPGSHDSFAPTIAADDGTVYVVWHDLRNGEKRDILASWSVNHGQNWATEPVRIDTDGAGFYDSVSADVVVRDGLALVAWQDARASAYDVFVREIESGWGPDPEIRLDTDSPGAANSLRPQILRDGDTVVVLWEDRRDDPGEGYNDLYYSFSLDGGDTWAEKDLRIDSLEPGTSYKRDVQAALDGGVLYVAWEDGRRGTSDIWFQALPVGEEAEYEAQ